MSRSAFHTLESRLYRRFRGRTLRLSLALAAGVSAFAALSTASSASAVGCTASGFCTYSPRPAS